MSIEIIQNSNTLNASAALVDDASGARVAHIPANGRLLSTLHFVITASSPTGITGLGGDTRVTLPGGAIPVSMRYYGKNNVSVTGATITVGIDTTSTYFLNGQNVSNAPTGSGQQTPATVSNLWLALAAVPLGNAHTVTGGYVEPATSATAGPWFCELDYYLPSPA